MQAVVPFACFLSVLRPPGVQFENSLLQIAPVDKSKCPFVKDNNDITFQLYTRHNPTVYQELVIGDDERLFASNVDFHDRTVIYFHAFMEQPEEGSGIMVREAYMQRGDTNVIMVDAHYLEAGPWYFTAAHNTWYIGNFAAQFVDYLVSRGLNLNNTHFIGHSLGAQSAGVAGSALKTGRVARITGLDAALPLFEGLPLEQRLDAEDALFVDTIHTDGGIFGFKERIGHVDFFPNGGISPQPGCELEIVIPQRMLLNKCDGRTHIHGFYIFYLRAKYIEHEHQKRFKNKLHNQFQSIQSSVSTNEAVTNDGTPKQRTIMESNTNDQHSFITNDHLKYQPLITDRIDRSEIVRILIDNNEPLVQVNDQETLKINDTLTLFENITPVSVEAEKLTVSHDADKTTRQNNDDVTIADKQFARVNNQTNIFIDQNSLKNNDTQNTNYEIKVNKKLTSVYDKREKVNVDPIKKDDQITVSKSNTLVHNGKQRKTSNVDRHSIQPQKATQATDPQKGTTEKPDILINYHHYDQEKPTNKKTEIPIQYRHITKQAHVDPNSPLEQITPNYPNLRSNDNQLTETKSHVVKRQKRFLPFLRSDNEDNLLFRMLNFLIKNRKSVLPVFTVMREINTLVRSGGGELSHFSKERNNYIGASAPLLPPVSYNLELGNESKAVAFVKRLFGLSPNGGRLTVSGSG